MNEGQEPRRGVHGGDKVTHLRQLIGRGVNDEVGALSDNYKIVIGDECRNFHDDVAVGFETRHF